MAWSFYVEGKQRTAANRLVPLYCHTCSSPVSVRRVARALGVYIHPVTCPATMTKVSARTPAKWPSDQSTTRTSVYLLTALQTGHTQMCEKVRSKGFKSCGYFFYLRSCLIAWIIHPCSKWIGFFCDVAMWCLNSIYQFAIWPVVLWVIFVLVVQISMYFVCGLGNCSCLKSAKFEKWQLG